MLKRPNLIIVEGPRGSGRTTNALALADLDARSVLIDECYVDRTAARRLGERFRVAVNNDRHLEGQLRKALREGWATVILVRLEADVTREAVAREILSPASVTRVRTFKPVTTQEAA